MLGKAYTFNALNWTLLSAPFYISSVIQAGFTTVPMCFCSLDVHGVKGAYHALLTFDISYCCLIFKNISAISFALCFYLCQITSVFMNFVVLQTELRCVSESKATVHFCSRTESGLIQLYEDQD